MNAANRGLKEPVVANIDVVAGRGRLGKADGVEPLVAERRVSRIEADLIEIAADQCVCEKTATRISRVKTGKRHLEGAIEVRSAEILSFRLGVSPGEANMQGCAVTTEVKARQIQSQLESAVILPDVGIACNRARHSRNRGNRPGESAGRVVVDAAADHSHP